MSHNIKFEYFILKIIILIYAVNILLSCSTDEILEAIPTGNSKEYQILRTNISDLTGVVEFIENTNGSTTISIQLNNTVEGINNPVSIHRNTANIGGETVLKLNNIDGKNGTSITTVQKLNNGQSINFNELSEFDGYLAISGQDSQKGLLIGYSDLGSNVLTGNSITYSLYDINGAVNGATTFREREKGTSSLTVNVFNIDETTILPCALYVSPNSETEYIHELATIKGHQNGFGFNEFTEINGNSILYNEIFELEAYIIIGNDATFDPFVAKGNIGVEAN